jgi:trk system potassium uptake protein TrkA
MKAVVVGCGRVGAGIADELDRAGWQVLIVDVSSAAFDRLPATFGGTALRGDGTDEDVLRRAGAENADLFLALTEGDNRNIMAAQLGIEALAARKTVAKVNDPVRAEAYAHLGIATLCRTNLMATQILGYAGQALPARPGIYVPENPHLHDTPVTAEPTSAGAAGSPGSPGNAGGVAVAGASDPAVDPSAEA